MFFDFFLSVLFLFVSNLSYRGRFVTDLIPACSLSRTAGSATLSRLLGRLIQFSRLIGRHLPDPLSGREHISPSSRDGEVSVQRCTLPSCFKCSGSVLKLEHCPKANHGYTVRSGLWVDVPYTVVSRGRYPLQRVRCARVGYRTMRSRVYALRRGDYTIWCPGNTLCGVQKRLFALVTHYHHSNFHGARGVTKRDGIAREEEGQRRGGKRVEGQPIYVIHAWELIPTSHKK